MTRIASPISEASVQSGLRAIQAATWSGRRTTILWAVSICETDRATSRSIVSLPMSLFRSSGA